MTASSGKLSGKSAQLCSQYMRLVQLGYNYLLRSEKRSLMECATVYRGIEYLVAKASHCQQSSTHSRVNLELYGVVCLACDAREERRGEERSREE